MREIKFRGKRKDNAEWVYGYYFASCGKSYIIRDDKLRLDWNGEHYEDLGCHTEEVISETVGQYTGLKDEKGRDAEVFDGDLVEMIRGEDGQKHVGQVVWDDWGRWVWKSCTIVEWCPLWQALRLHEGKVIGNIHTTPELLEKRKSGE